MLKNSRRNTYYNYYKLDLDIHFYKIKKLVDLP